MVVAKLTEFAGADQSSQLYIYGTPKPKPIPKIKQPRLNITKLLAKAIIKKPIATKPNPNGKILSCSFLKKNPNDSPIGMPTKFKTPVKAETSLTVPSFS